MAAIYFVMKLSQHNSLSKEHDALMLGNGIGAHPQIKSRLNVTHAVVTFRQYRT